MSPMLAWLFVLTLSDVVGLIVAGLVIAVVVAYVLIGVIRYLWEKFR
jgi:hypothetical protein